MMLMMIEKNTYVNVILKRYDYLLIKDESSPSQCFSSSPSGQSFTESHIPSGGIHIGELLIDDSYRFNVKND